MEEIKSKSQKKRDAETLQNIGVQLIALSLKKLNALPLPATLYQAILEAKSIKSHGAIRRQAQLIGKLMRSADSDAILTAYEAIIAEDKAKTAAFHDVELWRKKLIDEGNEAMTTFINTYHPTDLQQLKQLVKKAKEEKQANVCRGASKALFRFLRSNLS